LAQWRDTVGLHEYMLSIAPRSPGVHASLGGEFTRQGNPREAISHYHIALSESPGRAHIRYNLAIALQGLPDKADEAMEQYEEVLKANSMFSPQAALNLGNLHLHKGQIRPAIENYRKALEIRPLFVAARCNLGKALVIDAEWAEGIEHLREAVRLQPGFLLAKKELAWFLATHPRAEVRDANEAIRLAEQALAMTAGRDAGVLDTLAAAYALEGSYKKAVETAEKARAIATRVRNYELADQIQERLRLYQFECPYYEDPKVQLERLVARAKKPPVDRGRLTVGSNAEPAAENWELETENSIQEVQDEAETMQ
jgi:tetratricopeptide (TPR) repeat protein